MVSRIAAESQKVTRSEGPRIPDESLNDGVDESCSHKADPVIVDVRE